MYASSDVTIMMFFELFLLRKISEFPSATRIHNLQQLGNSDIFLSKNSSKNIIIIIVCLLLLMLSLKCDVADAVSLGEKKYIK